VLFYAIWAWATKKAPAFTDALLVELAGTGYYLTARQHFAKAKCSRGKQGKLKQPPAVFALSGSTTIQYHKKKPNPVKGSAFFGGAGGYCPRVRSLTNLMTTGLDHLKFT
jgi:hypothetical protein